MQSYIRYAALSAAALLAASTAAHAQLILTPDDPDQPAAIMVQPLTVIQPAVPGTIIAAPAAVPVETVVPSETIVAEPQETVETVVTRPPSAPSRIVTRRVVQQAPAARLSTVQRTRVYRTIMREPARTRVVTQRVVTQPAVTYRVGSVLPRSVPLYAMPQDVAYTTPAVRSYDYAIADNRVLLVDPATNMVVDEMY